MDKMSRKTLFVLLAFSGIANALNGSSIIAGSILTIVAIVFAWYGFMLKEPWFTSDSRDAE